MKINSIDSMYEKGLIKKGDLFVKHRKGTILKNSIYSKRKRYRKYNIYDIYRFRGVDDYLGRRYDFDYILTIEDNRVIFNRGSLSIGSMRDFELKSIKKIKFSLRSLENLNV